MATREVSGREEALARKLLRQRRHFGGKVESVAWIRRGDNEFAALVVPNECGDVYERALELLTDPSCPLTVTKVHEGAYDTRIYVAFTA